MGLTLGGQEVLGPALFWGRWVDVLLHDGGRWATNSCALELKESGVSALYIF